MGGRKLFIPENRTVVAGKFQIHTRQHHRRTPQKCKEQRQERQGNLPRRLGGSPTRGSATFTRPIHVLGC